LRNFFDHDSSKKVQRTLLSCRKTHDRRWVKLSVVILFGFVNV
jgi:hypothetical protein